MPKHFVQAYDVKQQMTKNLTEFFAENPSKRTSEIYYNGESFLYYLEIDDNG